MADPRTYPGHCGRCGFWATNDPLLRGLICMCAAGPIPPQLVKPIRKNGKRHERTPKG